MQRSTGSALSKCEVVLVSLGASCLLYLMTKQTESQGSGRLPRLASVGSMALSLPAALLASVSTSELVEARCLRAERAWEQVVWRREDVGMARELLRYLQGCPAGKGQLTSCALVGTVSSRQSTRAGPRKPVGSPSRAAQVNRSLPREKLAGLQFTCRAVYFHLPVPAPGNQSDCCRPFTFIYLFIYY